jgi:hypothetical protein
VADPQAATSIASYSNTVRFKEPGSNTTRAFVNANNQNGDARAVIVPFQIMNTVLDMNSSDELTILNIAITTTYTNKVRQSLMVGPKLAVAYMGKKHFDGKGAAKNVKLFAGSYVGNFADRSHLCPPSCLDAAFTTTSNPACP